jgi:hypothetical protein
VCSLVCVRGVATSWTNWARTEANVSCDVGSLDVEDQGEVLGAVTADQLRLTVGRGDNDMGHGDVGHGSWFDSHAFCGS